MSRRFAIVATLSLVMLFAATADAQPGRGRGGLGGNSFFLLMNETVQKELDISEDQLAEIRKLSEKLRDRELSREDRAELSTKIQDEIESDILFRPQRERLAQIQNQQRARGSSGGLTSDYLREELDITDKQLEEIREVAEEANEELQEKIAELRADAQKKILGVLSSSQRRKYEDMMGKPFELGRGGFGQGGQGRGGNFGGRGGGRGGDGGGQRGGGTRPQRPDA